MTVLTYQDYRGFLKNLLEEKCQKNPSFSLRSFAQSLGLSASHMSRVLSGSKKLSPTMAQQISHRLRLTKAEQTYFHLLVQLELTKDPGLHEDLLKQASQSVGQLSRVVGLERFKIISDWQHFAILAMVKMRSFQSNPAWIAKKLDLKVIEVSNAIERLISVELLEQDAAGNLTAVEGGDFTTTDDIASSAIKENHRQQMKRADKALTEQPVKRREFGNLAVAMKIRDVEKAKKLIREFTEKFNKEMDDSAGTEVFQMNIQFFQSPPFPTRGPAQECAEKIKPKLKIQYFIW